MWNPLITSNHFIHHPCHVHAFKLVDLTKDNSFFPTSWREDNYCSTSFSAGSYLSKLTGKIFVFLSNSSLKRELGHTCRNYILLIFSFNDPLKSQDFPSGHICREFFFNFLKKTIDMPIIHWELFILHLKYLRKEVIYIFFIIGGVLELKTFDFFLKKVVITCSLFDMSSLVE